MVLKLTTTATTTTTTTKRKKRGLSALTKFSPFFLSLSFLSSFAFYEKKRKKKVTPAFTYIQYQTAKPNEKKTVS